MDDSMRIEVTLFDVLAGEEVEGVRFPAVSAVPRVGERIHYWQDGTEESATGDALDRRDFEVLNVEHDWRYMPARGMGHPRYYQTVILRVREIKEPA